MKWINDIGVANIRFNTTLMNITDFDRNINKTNFEIWVAPYKNWHEEIYGYDISNLNLTWVPWKF